jgi:DNA-binding CsgD family transcriptional regulator
MAVDGAFDQEIAQALFLTTPTVRQTLDAVRGRFGVSSAQQLRNVVAAR